LEWWDRYKSGGEESMVRRLVRRGERILMNRRMGRWMVRREEGGCRERMYR
jgi:hypothetical protein